MDPRDIARLVPEDVSSDIIGHDSIAAVTYVNRDGQTRQFNIVPELTEDRGTTWTVALAGTGIMGELGAGFPAGGGSSHDHTRKNTKLVKNPNWSPEIFKAKQTWDANYQKWLKQRLGQQPTTAAVGIDDEDELTGLGDWRLRHEFEGVAGPRPQEPWMSRWRRNDTFKRITLVKSRVKVGLPLQNVPLKNPKYKTDEGYWDYE